MVPADRDRIYRTFGFGGAKKNALNQQGMPGMPSAGVMGMAGGGGSGGGGHGPGGPRSDLSHFRIRRRQEECAEPAGYARHALGRGDGDGGRRRTRWRRTWSRRTEIGSIALSDSAAPRRMR